MTIIICNNCGHEIGQENPFSMRDEDIIYISNCQDCMIFHQKKEDTDEGTEVEKQR